MVGSEEVEALADAEVDATVVTPGDDMMMMLRVGKLS